MSRALGFSQLTLLVWSAILNAVLTLGRRLHAIGLILALVAGNGAVCAGWAPTPEARMACCSEGGDCPMHMGDGHHSEGANLPTQAQADSCCASSEGDTRINQAPPFVVVISGAVLGPGVVVPVTSPALVLSDAWRTSCTDPARASP